jgi:DNA-binding NtrC family response regulator
LFRLAVVVIHIRRFASGERRRLCREGISPAIRRAERQTGMTFAPETLRAISIHRWPGNVRELQNRVPARCDHGGWKARHGQDMELTEPSRPSALTLKEAREAVERDMIQES